jgi:hypothetical protein
MTRIETAIGICPKIGTPATTASSAASRTVSSKIKSIHLNKLAVVYIRQSSPQQVVNHRESRERQYALVDHAVSLGWPCERVMVIDEDQGRSGATADNRSARNGAGRLPGLLICGIFGARMVVQYKKNSLIRYCRLQHAINHAGKQCQALKGNPLEELVREKVLSVLEPAAIELSIRADADIQRNRDQLHRHWQQRLERVRYQTERAHRQYDAVEPENRLVVRDLEQRWESEMRSQRQLEEEYDRFCLEQPRLLSSKEKDAIRSLSSVIPTIWSAPETTPQDRKLIVRQFVERVVVQRNGDIADVTIHWAGGYASAHQVSQPVHSFKGLRDFKAFKQRVLELHWAGRSYPEICAQLVAERFPSPKGRMHFRPENIRTFLQHYCSEELGPGWGSFREFLAKDEWLIGDLSRELGIPQATLQFWRRRGWVNGRQLRPGGGRWILWADADELERLRKLRACPINTTARHDRYPKELVTPKSRP